MTPEISPEQFQRLRARVCYQLLTRLGKHPDEATNAELFLAMSYAFREAIVLQWVASETALSRQVGPAVYYLSMEYLPGKTLRSGIDAFHRQQVLRELIKSFGRDYEELIRLDPEPGLGNGGLGRLASCMLEAAATQRLPVRGYGLRYQYGIFEQQVWGGVQVERPDMWLAREFPWEFRRDGSAVYVHFGGKSVPIKNTVGDYVDDLTDFSLVRALPYDMPIIGYPSCDQGSFITTLRLWSTKESPRNFELQSYNSGRLDQAAENTVLTDVLYPADSHDAGRRTRLKQEFLLVSASLQDIFQQYFATHQGLAAFADSIRIQINDTHPSLIIAELMRMLTKSYSMPWSTALNTTMQVCSFTNHTIMKEALEQWEVPWLRTLLPRQTAVIERLNLEFLNRVRQDHPGDEELIRRVSIVENNQVRMAPLAIVGSHRVNGVAPLHTDLLQQQLFPDYDRLFPNRFCNITNGVSPRRWVLECNPRLAAVLDDTLGQGWRTDWGMVAQLQKHVDDRQLLQRLIEIKQANKEHLAFWMLQHVPYRDQKGRLQRVGLQVNPRAIFQVHAKRLHEYKRQLLSALGLIVRMIRIKRDPRGWQPIVFIFAGKAAPGYRNAKAVLQLITALEDLTQSDPVLRELMQVIFLENWDVTQAQQVIPASDLSVQIPCPGYEASGTGNMKFLMNGALTIGSIDGANIDIAQSVGAAAWPFQFGGDLHYIRERQHSAAYHPQQILDAHPDIAEALTMLRSGQLARYESERAAFEGLCYRLLEADGNPSPDPYHVLGDLPEYIQTQARVDELYRDEARWASISLLNIAGSGPFSIDRTIQEYNKLVWGAQQVDICAEQLRQLRQQRDTITF